MPYRYTTFNGQRLPDRMPEDDLSTGEVESSLIDSIGGVVDYRNGSRHLPRRLRIPYRGKYVGEIVYIVDEDGNNIVDEAGNYIIAGQADDMLRAQVDAIKSELGEWARLERQAENTGDVQWVTAQLLQVQHTQVIDNAQRVAECDLLFETQHIAWREEDAITESESCADGVAQAISLHNGGDVPVDDAVVTVTRTSGTITAFTLTGQGISFTYSGSLGAGDSVVIDTGAQTVRKNGGGDYANFALNAAHTMAGWLRLVLGMNALAATVSGGNATVTIDFYNQRL